MLRTLVLAAAISAASTSLTFADDYRWSGIYAGFHAGWGGGKVDSIEGPGNIWGVRGYEYGARAESFLGGGQIGYLHHHANNIVTGIELSVSSFDGSSSAPSQRSPVAFYSTIDTWNRDISPVFMATARLGYSFGRFLPYVEAGYAGGNVRMLNVRDYASCTPLCVSDYKRWHNGYVVGAGADYRVTRNIVAGLNYRFIDLGSNDHGGLITGHSFSSRGFSTYYSASAYAHAATFRLSWLYAAPESTAAARSVGVAGDYNWSGFYAGVHAGHSAAQTGWINTRGGWFFANPGVRYDAPNAGSFLGGGQIGYLHHHANNLVSGIELSVSDLDANKSVTGAANVTPVHRNGTDIWETDIDSLVMATGRLGYSFGRFLPYAEAGYAGGNVSMKNSSTFTEISIIPGFPDVVCAPCDLHTKKWHNGYVIGAGADYRVTDNIVAGLNYRFAYLDVERHAGYVTGQTRAPGQELHIVQAEVHSVAFRLNWLFNQN